MSHDLPKDELIHQPEKENTTPDTEETVSGEDPFAAFTQPQLRSLEDVTLSPKKKKRILLFSLIGAFAVLAVLIVLLLFVFPEAEPEDPTTDLTDTTVTILDKVSETEEVVISSAVLTHSDDTKIEFVNVDGELFVKGYEDLPANELNTTDLIAVLSAFTATRDLGELDNDAEFGFDEPLIVGTVSYLDESTFSFEIGDVVPDGTGYYFREQGSKKTYILPLANAETMLLKPLEYVSTTVFTGPTVDSSDTSSEVVLRDMALSGKVRAGNEFSFRLVTSEDSDKYLYYTYIITKPYTKGVDSTYTTDLAAFTSLEALSVAAVRPTAQQLSEFGLKTPYSVADFTLAVRSNTTVESDSGESTTVTTYSNLTTHTVQVGSKVGSYYYVMIDEVPIVYLVAEDSLPFATLQFNDLAATTLFLENITELQNVTVGVSGETTSFTLTHDPEDTDNDTNMTVTANGTTYDTMDFRYLMNVFMDIDWHSNLTKDIGDASERFSISLTKTGETEPVFSAKFYKLSGSLYAAVINNGEKYQVRASDVENAITQLENYMNGETVLY